MRTDRLESEGLSQSGQQPSQIPHIPCMATTTMPPSNWLLVFTAALPPSSQDYEGNMETSGIKCRKCTLSAMFASEALVGQACDGECWYKIQFQARMECQCPAWGVFTWSYSLLTLEMLVERLRDLWYCLYECFPVIFGIKCVFSLGLLLSLCAVL